MVQAGISSKAAGSLDNDIKFNGKELNEDLDLDWYEYGFRNNFDPQLGRFHSVDPLASDYPYYTPYQFAGNQVPNAIDVDGLEPAFFNDLVSWAAQKVATNPNSSTSKVIGAVAGVGASVQKTITGVGNVIAHPINTLQGIANLNTPEGMANMAIGVAGKVDAYNKGTGFEKSAIISEGVTDVVTAIVGTKGLGAAKGATTSATLFRAGSEAEAIGAANNGFSMLPSVVGKGSYETGKLFATSAADAAEFGRSNFLLDGVPNVIMKAKVPSSVMKTATTFEADGMKAVSIQPQQLQNIQFKGVLNSTPKPTNPFQWNGRW